jgi:uncharacterized protein YjiS (DUF1127 family)
MFKNAYLVRRSTRACTRAVVRSFAQWMANLTQRSARLLHRLVAAGGRRNAMRKLQRLDDLTLSDLGVPRCGIEFAVRGGQ